MGEQQVVEDLNDEQLGSFMRRILEDLRALEAMLDGDFFETGVRRVGAEQEMFLIDSTGNAAPVATELLELLEGVDGFTTELARFNLEVNLEPRLFGAGCLRMMEQELEGKLAQARGAANALGAEVLLAGILPTVRQEDLILENMTPMPRYAQLNQVMKRLRGGDFTTLIKGLDELSVHHDNILLEACNTSFQVHFQVGPGEFATLYNIAQAVTGPVLAAAVNSPFLLQHRLWRETRVALFQQSIDLRSSVHQKRGARARVRFGDRWVQDSIVELFREDIARARVVLTTEAEDDPVGLVKQGKAPSLAALRLHNGTVYRWNRPCYGVSEGRPHLRIENRCMPSGPTVLDEVANAAFYYGLMSAVLEEYGHIDKVMAFDDAAGNFLNAARHGLMAQLHWVGDRTYAAKDLILDRLLPLAREGLRTKAVDEADVERYLGVIEARVASGQTGSAWALRSLAEMGESGSRDGRFRAIVHATLDKQRSNIPVHEWPLVTSPEPTDWRHSYRLVGQFMIRDLFTLGPHDIVDLAAAMMTWEHIRHVPVEDDAGHLVGLVTHRDLLALVGSKSEEPVAIRSIMKTDLLTVTPSTTTQEAIRMMRHAKVGCLPVVEDSRLVGLVTETDLLNVAGRLLEAELARV